MTRGLDTLGNGRGYLYLSALDGTTYKGVYLNNIEGLRLLRHNLAGDAPIAASRSAIAKCLITGCASIGQISDFVVNGVDQIAGPLNVATATNSILATQIALAISSFNPGVGPNYYAVSSGDYVLVYEPQKSAGTSNGFLPSMAVTSGTITFVITPFENGAAPSGSVDGQYGQRVFLGPDDDNAVTPPDFAGELANCVEVSQYLVPRGTESGFPVTTEIISSDRMNFATSQRLSEEVLVYAQAEAGLTDVCAFINPAWFIEGDKIMIRSRLDTELIMFADARTAGTYSPEPFPNIYLNSSTPTWVTAGNGETLTLQYHYDDVLGPIFLEVARSNPRTIINIFRQNTIFIDGKFGDDALGQREMFYPNVFKTADAAYAAGQAGDTYVFSNDIFAITQRILQRANTTVDLTSGATLTGNDWLATIAAGSKIIGGNVIHTGVFAPAPGDYSMFDVDNLEIGIILFNSPSHFTINVKNLLTCHGYINIITAQNTYLKWTRAVLDASLGLSFGIGMNSSALNSVPQVEGDIYVTAGHYDAFIRCENAANLVYNPRYKGNIYVSPGVVYDHGIRSYTSQTSGAASPYRFIVDGEFHCPVEPTISFINALGGGEIEVKGKLFLANQGAKPAVISDTDASTRNLPSKVWLTDCDIYSDTTGDLLKIADAGFTVLRSRIIGKNVSLIAPAASSCINGDVAGCKYQCKGMFANAVIGANAANELGTTDIQVDALML